MQYFIFMEKLHRKTYSIEIEIPRKILKPKVIKFKFKQATFGQLLEMMHWLKDGSFDEYLFYFLNNICIGKISEKDLSKINIKHMNNIYSFLMSTFGKGFFSKKTKNKKNAKNIPFNSFLASMCSQLIPFNDFLELTWEQIEYLADGLIWNNNETTKKGRRENMMKLMKDKLDNTDRNDAIKAIISLKKRIEKKRKKG